MRKSWLKGAKFLCRKKKATVILTVIRNTIETYPEITIAELQDQVHEKVSRERTAAYLFFHKMLMKELSDMNFRKCRGHWYATRKKKKTMSTPSC